jgi:alkanesulfonate monooxygenase SsuD/methylene tetrahydromethanopterin reductase-like flavin-dependent oxidoreductase (luciferase family)
VKTGVILPSFRDDAAEALDVARRADESGVDGVFCYDHLWPMGRPDRPALAPFPLLAAVAATTRRVAVGTLVARIGLVPDGVLVSEVDALRALAPGRVVVGLGTGDHLSARENEAYGVPFAPAAERRASLREVAAALAGRGVPVWIGGGGPATRQVAVDARVAVNLWDAGPGAVAAQAHETEVTWAGPSPEPASGGAAAPGAAPDGAAALAGLLPQLHAAGATWAVFGWPVPLEALVATAGGLTAGQ